MRFNLIPILTITLWSVASLATIHGDVTMKIDPSHGLISFGEHKVSPGDRVVLYKKTCAGSKLPVCRSEKIGGGHVVRVLNESYSEVETDNGVHFQVGYTVEKG